MNEVSEEDVRQIERELAAIGCGARVAEGLSSLWWWTRDPYWFVFNLGIVLNSDNLPGEVAEMFHDNWNINVGNAYVQFKNIRMREG